MLALAGRALPIAVIAVAGAAYLATLARFVLGGDNGEFAALAAVGGVAHPPGYPLYVLWLRAFRWLPASSPAHAAAMATTLLGVATLVLLYLGCRAWGASIAASSVVVSAHGFSTRAWLASTHAEVFALNTVIAAAILLVVALRASEPHIGGARRVALLALLAGLGLSNHHSIVLLAPIGIYGVVRGMRELPARRARLAAAALGIASFALGLLPYAYLVVVSRNPGGHFVWGETSTMQGLFFHLRRGEYGTTSLGLAQASAPVSRIGNVVALLVDVTRGLAGLPIVAIAASLLARGKRTSQGLRRTGKWLLFASFALAGPCFTLLFNLSTEGLDRLVVERFWLFPQLILAVLVAPLLDPALSAIFARKGAAAAITFVVAAFSALFAFIDVREHQRPSVELYVRNTLASVPPSAVLVGSGDHRFGGFLYAERALQLRTDVIYVDAYLMLDRWYFKQIERALGVTLTPPANRSLSTTKLAAEILATGRPLFLANPLTKAIPESFTTYPIGTLVRVLPPGNVTPNPIELETWNEEIFSHFEMEAAPPELGTWGGDLQKSYVLPWTSLADAFDRIESRDRAGVCRERAAIFSPR
jgi:hypothetical protein